MSNQSKRPLKTVELEKKIEIGDFILASKLLNLSAENTRARFYRGKEDVTNALLVIIENRENLIEKYRGNENYFKNKNLKICLKKKQ